jgi:copper homeostasis protein
MTQRLYGGGSPAPYGYTRKILCVPPRLVLLESCVDSLESATASARGGADRIELCANLDAGGTTPDIDLIRRCSEAIDRPVFVMIRPRGGDFCYDAADLQIMTRDIGLAKSAGARGIVVGALAADRTIDVDAMRRLIHAVRPLPVTCHRAFDAAGDLDEALDTLVTLGVDRVLTSGGAPTAAEGAEVIADLVTRAGDAVVVMAGGGVRARNVADLVRRTKVREVHARLAGAEVVEIVAAMGRGARA